MQGSSGSPNYGRRRNVINRRHERASHDSIIKGSNKLLHQASPGVNNLQEFLELFIPEVQTTFGSLYKVIKERAAYTPPAPVMPSAEELDPDVDYAGANKARWLEQEKMHEAEKKKIKLEEPKFYAFIWTHLTKRSQEVVERHPDYREIKEACDPVRLWQITYEVHTATPPSTIVEDRLRIENEWSAMRQGEHESLDKWRERISNEVPRKESTLPIT
jgi:hypothetical protein